jgi:phosphoglycolate phosphatase
MTGKIIIFDFDGTLADTYEAIVKIANQLADEFGYKPVDKEELLQLKNLSSQEIVRQSKISLFKIPFLLRRVHLELGKDIAKFKPIKGIKETLSQLKAQGYYLVIVTSNSKDNVVNFLVNHKLEDLFDFIYPKITIFGKHRAINTIIKQYEVSKGEAIYVGDETRDIRSAKKSGIPVIAVSWGFNSAAILAEHKPDFLIEQPAELIEAIARWNNSWQEQLQSKS